MKKILYRVFVIVLIFMNVGLLSYIVNNDLILEYVNEDDVATEESVKFKDIENKKILVLGDSLMNGYLSIDGGISLRLKKVLSDTNEFMDFSKVGSTISINTVNDTTGEDIAIINQAKKAELENPDIVIFNGGVNDIIGYVEGYLEKDKELDIGYVENYIDDFSKENENSVSENVVTSETVLGDFEKTVDYMENTFKNAKLVYIQMYALDQDTLEKLSKSENERNIITLKYDALFNGIKEICNEKNIIYIDASSFLAGTKNEYRQEDYIHFKDSGYEKVMEEILNKLNEEY